jgi:hypothetical protein
MDRQICKVCGRPDKFAFKVCDKTWEAVVPPPLRNKVVCLPCFDDMADMAGVDYTKSLKKLYFAGDRAQFIFHRKN